MKLSVPNFYRYSLPLARPLRLAGATLHRREGLLLELTDAEGRTGWGEASPLPGFSKETLDDATGQLRRLAVRISGYEMTGADPPGGFLRGPDLAPSVRFGFELAVRNLRAAVQGETLAEVMAAHPAESVVLTGLLAGSEEGVLADARRMRNSGYRVVKLKVGGRTVEADVDLVRAVSRTLGEGVSLRLDANRAWSMEEAVSFARGVDRLPIEYVEEPLASPASLPDLVRKTGVPVALDETLTEMEPEGLDRHRYARAVVLKPTLLGGVSCTLRLAEWARSLGIEPVVSSAYETGVGMLGLVAIAAAVGETSAGLDTYRALAADVIKPRLELGARINVPETMRLRYEVARGSLKPIG